MQAKSSNIFKVGLCQIKTMSDKQQNLKRAEEMIRQAASAGADIIVLPEMFVTPYTKHYMQKDKEPLLPDYQTNQKCQTTFMLSNLAKSLRKYIIGGSIPEEIPDEERIYNTCLCFNREGEIVAEHRKLHMFDINIPGGITFYESSYVKPGPPKVTIFDTEYCKIGIGICYDIRFPEYAQLMNLKGADMICYPANFALRTGELHFDLLKRARAIDTQCYLMACGSATNIEEPDLFQSWAHSSVISPWGKILAEAESKEELILADIDMAQIKEVREQIMTSMQKRKDIYELIKKVD